MRCAAICATKRRCKKTATTSDGYCSLHAAIVENKKSEADPAAAEAAATMCSICSEAVKRGPHSGRYKTECGHVFHMDCLGKWYGKCLCNAIASNRPAVLTCPMCRQSADPLKLCSTSWSRLGDTVLRQNRRFERHMWIPIHRGSLSVTRDPGHADIAVLANIRDAIDRAIVNIEARRANVSKLVEMLSSNPDMWRCATTSLDSALLDEEEVTSQRNLFW